jgi:hypothetical protein
MTGERFSDQIVDAVNAGVTPAVLDALDGPLPWHGADEGADVFVVVFVVSIVRLSMENGEPQAPAA